MSNTSNNKWQSSKKVGGISDVPGGHLIIFSNCENLRLERVAILLTEHRNTGAGGWRWLEMTDPGLHPLSPHAPAHAPLHLPGVVLVGRVLVTPGHHSWRAGRVIGGLWSPSHWSDADSTGSHGALALVGGWAGVSLQPPTAERHG